MSQLLLTPKEERLDQRIPISRGAELGQNICRVVLAIHMNKVADAASLSFTGTMVIQDMIALQEPASGKSGTVNNAQIITENPSTARK